MLNNIHFLMFSCLGFGIAGGSLVSAAPQQSTTTFTDSSQSFSSYRETLDRYCVTCHNQTLKTAGLLLDDLDPTNLGKDANIWEKVLRKLRNQEMPPAGMPRPDALIYEGLIVHIETGLDRLAETHPNPGRPAVHRLNRTEYSNVLRDLLAVEINIKELLPADDMGYGFDNIADVLTVSPFLMERYMALAGRLSRLAVGDIDLPPTYQDYSLNRSLRQEDRMSEDMPYGSRGGTAVRHYFPVDGEYIIQVQMQEHPRSERGVISSDNDRKLDIRLDGERIGSYTITADGSISSTYNEQGDQNRTEDSTEVRIKVDAGYHTVMATFAKDTTKSESVPARYSSDATGNREPTSFEGVGKIIIGGPFNVTGSGNTDSRNKVFICYPSSNLSEDVCAKTIISNLTRRAYRRPVVDNDLGGGLRLYEEGKALNGFEAGIRMALQGILVAPEFLFRMEFAPPNVKHGDSYHINDIELASRLSFFLWSSIPDDELLTIAESGVLREPAILQHQIQRMLTDPRSKELVKNFTGQWLFLRNIERVLPDPVAFPSFDDNLRQALQKETELLVDSMFHEDRSVVELLDFDYTFVNERLARHYGIDGIYGSEFRRVQIIDETRKGLLGQGSILTATSYANRTAPTIRGKWILEQILGSPPPAPPPNVPTLQENDNTKVLTMRERMEMHRANPACAACHKVMDPIGFALENFDGVGRWRDTINNAPIDTSGILPDGTSFEGPAGLQKLLLSKQDLFVETFIEKLLTYALGRGVEYYDLPVIRKIRKEVADSNYSWSSIISGIVNSVPFQMRNDSVSIDNRMSLSITE